MKMKLKRFNKLVRLKAVRRDLLARFLDQFQAELEARGLGLGSELDDADYYQSLIRLLMAPEWLPDGLNEALFAVDEMATPEGREQLERALGPGRSETVISPDSSDEDAVVQAWLAEPQLLAQLHNRQRLARLSSFEYFGSRQSPKPFAGPDVAALAGLAAGLDGWFSRHSRGQQAVRIEWYPIDGELWFLVRHGDTYTRTPTVDRQRTEVIHFRPEKDDVVVYSPELDEIRINTRTRGERDLYVEQFGLWLRGAGDYFSERRTYTLEPLRTDGAEALDTAGVEGIARITLRGIEVTLDNGFHEVTLHEADDLFQCAAAGASADNPIPKDGQLTRAAFEVHFADCAKPRLVHVRLPNILKLGRHCDACRVGRWLSRRGFRTNRQERGA